MLYMVAEKFVVGAQPIYERLQAQGRMLPEGLTYIDSWVTDDLTRCFQVMSCDDSALLDDRIAQWRDLAEFEIFPVVSSVEAKSIVSVSSAPGT